MITKLPRDIFEIDAIRSFYRQRPDILRCIITIRDPRSVLTSRHVNDSAEYYVDFGRWQRTYDHYRKQRDRCDVATVRYEDVLTQIDLVEQQLCDFVGWKLSAPFRDYYDRASQQTLQDQVQLNLNGLRPLEPDRAASWMAEKHAARIRAILKEIPQMPRYLLEMGYETDDSWTGRYQ